VKRRPPPIKARHRDINLELWQGDAAKVLRRRLVPGDVQCAITSPPYYGMRVYETGNEYEIGREESLDEYVWNLVDTFNELRRVLADDGIFWLNIADCYANSNRRGHKFPSDKSTLTAFRNGRIPPTHRVDESLLGQRKSPGWYQSKQLIPVSWTVAMAMQDEGWFLRAANIWHKPNVVPSSARDRPGLDYEFVFMFTKQPRYTYYPDAVKQPAKWERWGRQTVPKHEGTGTAPGWIQGATKEEVQAKGGGLRNLRTVWTIPTSNYPGQHFATFPEQLVERCIAASTKPGDLVLDPFVGSGTTAAVALNMGRRAFGIDLVKDFLDQSVVRCGV
jgi:DNA modification methylase